MPYRLTYNDCTYIQCDVCGRVHLQLFSPDTPAPPLPHGWGGGPSHTRCPACQATWPHTDAEARGLDWKSGTPVPIRDHWTGQPLGPVFPGRPPEHYPRGYFRSFNVAQIPYYSRQTKAHFLQQHITRVTQWLRTVPEKAHAEYLPRPARWQVELTALLAEIAADR